MTSKIDSHNKLSLREQYAAVSLNPADTKAPRFDKEFLSPNEGGADVIASHFENLKNGIGVSTGTERVFFEALYSGAWCQGWVSRDINHRVKAYGDFNLCLFAVMTFEEYGPISERATSLVQITERVAIVRARVQSSHLPEPVKQYYIQTAQAYGDIYLLEEKTWRTKTQFKSCWYHQNKEQYAKLQRYAQEGSIIFTVGEINDLGFLRERTISVVDTSNIHLFSPINLQGEGQFAPRIIWTDQNYEQTKFYSMNYFGANTCQLCESQAVKPLLGQLILEMRRGNIDRYLEFVQISGWQDELERQFYTSPSAIFSFLGFLSIRPAYEQQHFRQHFGERRLKIVKAKNVAWFTFLRIYCLAKETLVKPPTVIRTTTPPVSVSTTPHSKDPVVPRVRSLFKFAITALLAYLVVAGLNRIYY